MYPSSLPSVETLSLSVHQSAIYPPALLKNPGFSSSTGSFSAAFDESCTWSPISPSAFPPFSSSRKSSPASAASFSFFPSATFCSSAKSTFPFFTTNCCNSIDNFSTLIAIINTPFFVTYLSFTWSITAFF